MLGFTTILLFPPKRRFERLSWCSTTLRLSYVFYLTLHQKQTFPVQDCLLTVDVSSVKINLMFTNDNVSMNIFHMNIVHWTPCGSVKKELGCWLTRPSSSNCSPGKRHVITRVVTGAKLEQDIDFASTKCDVLHLGSQHTSGIEPQTSRHQSTFKHKMDHVITEINRSFGAALPASFPYRHVSKRPTPRRSSISVNFQSVFQSFKALSNASTYFFDTSQTEKQQQVSSSTFSSKLPFVWRRCREKSTRLEAAEALQLVNVHCAAMYSPSSTPGREMCGWRMRTWRICRFGQSLVLGKPDTSSNNECCHKIVLSRASANVTSRTRSTYTKDLTTFTLGCLTTCQ